MAQQKDENFGAEIAKVLPHILRKLHIQEESVIKRGNLSVTNIVILDILREKNSCTMGELSKSLNLSMGAVTGIVDKMIEAGLVKRERSEKDRRVVQVELLGKGQDMAKQVNRDRENIANELCAPLTREERATYLRILKKVYRNIFEAKK